MTPSSPNAILVHDFMTSTETVYIDFLEAEAATGIRHQDAIKGFNQPMTYWRTQTIGGYAFMYERRAARLRADHASGTIPWPRFTPLEVMVMRKMYFRPKVKKTKSLCSGIDVTVTPLKGTGKWAVLHFQTIKEAAEDLNLNYRSVLSNLSGQRHKDTLPIFMGYYWQRSTDTRPFPRTT